MKLRLCLTLCIALLLAMTWPITGCDRAEPDPAAGRVALRVGYRPKALLDVTPIWFAAHPQAAGNVDIVLVPVSSPQDGFAKLDVGEVDALAGITFEPLLQRAAAADFRIYLVQADVENGFSALIARKGSGVSSVADLANRTVAALPTQQAQFITTEILAASGIPRDQIKVGPMAMAAPLAGLATGEHEAILLPEPMAAQALQAGHKLLARGVISSVFMGGKKAPISVSLISDRWVTEHPKQYSDFLTAVDQALVRIDADPSGTKALFASEENGAIPAEVRELMRFPYNNRPTVDPELREVMILMQRKLVHGGLQSEMVDLTRVLRE